ncbi:MAG: competence protein ComGC [Lysobacterales bacterium]|jgi:competence protein ComGC
MNRKINKIGKNSGFTLVELILVAGIMSVTIVGLLNLFIFTSTGAELAGSKTRAIAEAQTVLEEIHAYNFDDIVTDYASGGAVGDDFDLTYLPGKGTIYIDSSNVDLLEVHVTICWRDKTGRILGEDTDLDGVLDAGEDVNGNNEIDSIVRLSTMVARR